MMRIGLSFLLLAALLPAALVGCGSGTPAVPREVPVEVSGVGPGTIVVSARDVAVSGIVVYFHGADQKADVVRESEKHRGLFAPMLRAGYAVIAADAAGNAFGNPASRSAYRRLIAAAEQRYQVKKTFFVAESMGSLAALALLREDVDRNVLGFIGISPLMGLPPVAREQSYIKSAWGGAVGDDADPMTWPVSDFAGREFLLFVPENDTVIPAAGDARAFASRFGGAASIEVESCSGDHVDPTCYQGDTSESWMTRVQS